MGENSENSENLRVVNGMWIRIRKLVWISNKPSIAMLFGLSPAYSSKM